MLADLGVTQSHLRPHLANDNLFSESRFKTLESHAAFGSIELARLHCQDFFSWYNAEPLPLRARASSHSVRKDLSMQLSESGGRHGQDTDLRQDRPARLLRRNRYQWKPIQERPGHRVHPGPDHSTRSKTATTTTTTRSTTPASTPATTSTSVPSPASERSTPMLPGRRWGRTQIVGHGRSEHRWAGRRHPRPTIRT